MLIQEMRPNGFDPQGALRNAVAPLWVGASTRVDAANCDVEETCRGSLYDPGGVASAPDPDAPVEPLQVFLDGRHDEMPELPALRVQTEVGWRKAVVNELLENEMARTLKVLQTTVGRARAHRRIDAPDRPEDRSASTLMLDTGTRAT